MSLHTYAGFIAENEKSCGDCAMHSNKVHLRITNTPLPTGLCNVGRSSDSVAKLATLQIGNGKMRKKFS